MNCFLFHDWSQWKAKTVRVERMLTVDDRVIDKESKKAIIDKYYQQRKCFKCGKIEQEYLQFPGDGNDYDSSKPSPLDSDGI